MTYVWDLLWHKGGILTSCSICLPCSTVMHWFSGSYQLQPIHMHKHGEGKNGHASQTTAFLSPNQQRQSTEGNIHISSKIPYLGVHSDRFHGPSFSGEVISFGLSWYWSNTVFARNASFSSVSSFSYKECFLSNLGTRHGVRSSLHPITRNR